MNIFATDPSPVRCAEALDDKRVNKMVLETAQILSTVLWRYNGTHALRQIPGLYKATHTGHPCTQWAGRTRSNFLWLCEHGFALADVYKKSFYRTHKSKTVIASAFEYASTIPDGPLTEFANCTDFKGVKWDHLNIHQKYKAQMNLKWSMDNYTPTWKNRQPPIWRM